MYAYNGSKMCRILRNAINIISTESKECNQLFKDDRILRLMLSISKVKVRCVELNED